MRVHDQLKFEILVFFIRAVHRVFLSARLHAQQKNKMSFIAIAARSLYSGMRIEHGRVRWRRRSLRTPWPFPAGLRDSEWSLQCWKSVLDTREDRCFLESLVHCCVFVLVFVCVCVFARVFVVVCVCVCVCVFCVCVFV